MADYQTTRERWECELCGEVEYDIVPSHACPYNECEECDKMHDTRDDGNETYCQECLDYFETDEYKAEKEEDEKGK